MVGIAPSPDATSRRAKSMRGAPDVALISESLWERAFGRDPAAVGRTLRLNELPFTVIGVLPDAADFGALQILEAAAYSRGFADRDARSHVDVWVAIETGPGIVPPRHAPDLRASDDWPRDRPRRPPSRRPRPSPRTSSAPTRRTPPAAHSSNRSAQVVLGPGAPGAVRASRRGGARAARGVGERGQPAPRAGRGAAARGRVRTALGASAGRLARQFLVEGLLLTLIAAAAGVALAFAGLKGLLAIAPPDVPRLSLVTIDVEGARRHAGPVWSSSASVFGLVPTFQTRRARPAGDPQGGGRPPVVARPRAEPPARAARRRRDRAGGHARRRGRSPCQEFLAAVGMSIPVSASSTR